MWVRDAVRSGLLALALLAAMSQGAVAADTVRIGGTGMGLALMRQAGDRLAAAEADIRAEILPSLGTNGGLKAVAVGELDIALSARPMKPEEAAKGLREAHCVTTALIFASSRPDPAGTSAARLPALYADAAPAWPDGMPLKVILRARSGSENPYLVEKVPGLADALAAAYRRPGMPIGTTDQENAEVAERTAGSFAVLTLMQLRTERLKLHPIAFEGVMPSPASIADGSYPLPMRLCLVLPANPSAGAVRFIRFLGSAEGRSLVEAAGAQAPL